MPADRAAEGRAVNIARGMPRVMIDPQPGHWLIRLVRGGPRVPACIAIVKTTTEPGRPDNGTRSPFIAAFIAGEPAAVDDVWLRRGEPITEREYRFRCADAAWAREHAPDDPQASPRRRIDLMKAPLPF